jgi:hypothetical protein
MHDAGRFVAGWHGIVGMGYADRGSWTELLSALRLRHSLSERVARGLQVDHDETIAY